MGLKCFVCGPLAALVICLITACLADPSRRSAARQRRSDTRQRRSDELITRITVNNVGKTEWLSLMSPVAVMVEKHSEEDEVTASVVKNKLSLNTKDGTDVLISEEETGISDASSIGEEETGISEEGTNVLNASSTSEEETGISEKETVISDEAIGKRLARNIEYLVEQGHHNFRFDDSVRVDVLLPCLEAMDVPSTTPNINITSKMFLELVHTGWLKKKGFFDKYVVVRKEKDDSSGSAYLVYNDKDTPDHNRFDFKGTLQLGYLYDVEVYFFQRDQKVIYYEENGNLREKITLKERDWIEVTPKGGWVPNGEGWTQNPKYYVKTAGESRDRRETKVRRETKEERVVDQIEGSDDKKLTSINVTNVGKKEWANRTGQVVIMVGKDSEEGEVTASVMKNQISWTRKDGSSLFVGCHGIDCPRLAKENETGKEIGNKLERDFKRMENLGLHNFRFDDSFRVDVLGHCLEAMQESYTKYNINVSPKMFLKLVQNGWLKKAGFFDKYVVVKTGKDDSSGSTYFVFNEEDTPDQNQFDFKGTFEQYNVKVYFLPQEQKFIYYEENGNARVKLKLTCRNWIRVTPKGVVPKV
eukprot:GHVS01036497.1.p1 GENE.GHVS01036497.1~~GHVS01036497.1.p1  ORF type:complete len:587 (+),score=44.98 GHVS01036497.1:42-1802(+)